MTNQGDTAAQTKLGRGYEKIGRYDDAAKWYKLVAEQGYAVAQFSLGELYLLGRGVRQDIVLAHMGVILASARLPKGELQAKADQAQDQR